MADLSYIDSTLEVKLVGQDSTGNRANYVGADANGNMTTKDYSDGPVTPGTVALASALIGGQYNSSLPTLTNTQQSAIQLDSSGRLLVNVSNASIAVTGTFWQATQPVSGTVAATQSGTWTVQPGNTQNTTAWLTQDAADGPVTPGTVALASALIGGQYNSTAPTLTTGQQVALQTDASGNLKVTATVVAIVFGALTTGSKSSIGTSAVQISSTSVVASSGVTLRSALANSATIYIGPSTVTANTAAATNGIPLNPGESINMPLNNLNLLYAIATATGQEIFWMVI